MGCRQLAGLSGNSRTDGAVVKRELPWIILSIALAAGFSVWLDHRNAAEQNAYVCAIDSDHTKADIRYCFAIWGMSVPQSEHYQ